MSGDREALVSMLAGAGVWLDRCDEVADQILDSDWLAEHDAEILRDAAMRIDAEYREAR